MLDGRTLAVGLRVKERAHGRYYYHINKSLGARPVSGEGAGDTNPSRTERESRPIEVEPDAGEINLDLVASDRRPAADDRAPLDMPALMARIRAVAGRDIRIETEDGTDRQGAYIRDTDGQRIVIAAALDALDTVNHELIHALRDMGLFSDAEWATLSRAAQARWLRRYDIAGRYPDYTQEMRIEEAVAEAFMDFAAGRRARERGVEPRGVLALIDRIARVLDAMGSWLRGAGFVSTDDVFGRVDSGEVGAREGGVENDVSREQAKPTNAQAWRNAIGIFFGEKRGADGRTVAMPSALMLGDDYPVFAALAKAARPLFVLPGSLREIMREHPEVTRRVLESLEPTLRDPAFVFRGEKAEQNLATVVGRMPDGRAMIVAVRPNTTTPQGQKAHMIASIYVKNDREWLSRQLASDRLLYARETPANPRGTPGPIPGSGSPKATSWRGERKILTAADVFKADITRDRRRNAAPGPFETYEARSARELAAMFLPRNWKALADARNWNEVGLSLRPTLQDSMIDVRRQQQAIEAAQGAPLDLAQDVYLQQSLYAGRTGERLQKLYEGPVKRIAETIRDERLDARLVDDYLIALHAE